MAMFEIEVLPGGRTPTRAYWNDAGWDLYSAVDEPVVIEPGVHVDIPCKIKLGTPDGYWVRIVGRSSTLRRLGLLVIEGVIDAGYRGEIFVGVLNPGVEPVIVEPGSRLAQAIVHPVIDVLWREVQAVLPSDRGGNGFGSSGS